MVTKGFNLNHKKQNHLHQTLVLEDSSGICPTQI